ncbi:hypothetical protein PPERSA_08208 [Pseudocohnilembus persalinus]|uniref:NFACT RNA-binding domain-containing protein n=1 Tax=Pseudocohnilembus persalinus TaxID=266149 RepID=A0A0V0QFW3_PSEPJ|nr:hypothetical protein PPERSA_08208 [Pseudocohnilembus persalinus]|eukprot:KRX01107.1 hypothetical protein PPERSA_08208 [Pseudocohnilembus persalinus]
MQGPDQKQELIIENGVRFNTTSSDIQKKKTPSAFCMKFRKFLRSKRLENIQQVGVERVVIFTFGTGEFQNHLILELYSQGNIILTDSDFVIIQLIRSHEFSETVKTAVGEKYPFDLAANLYLEKFDISEDNIRKLTNKMNEQQDDENQKNDLNKQEEDLQKDQKEEDQKKEIDDDEILSKNKQKKLNKQMKEQESQKQQEAQKKNKQNKKDQKKGKQEKEKKLKDIIFKLVPSLHQPVIDSVILENQFNPNAKCSEVSIQDIQNLAQKCIQLQKYYMTAEPKGYLVVSEKNQQQNQEKNDQNQENKEKQIKNESYFEFSPLVLKMYEGKVFKEMASFNKVIDIYFQQLGQNEKDEGHKYEGISNQKQSIILKKFNNIIRDQDQRIQALQTEQEASFRKAYLIERNIHDVDAIASIIKQMIQGGISWDKIYKMVNEGKENGDPLANIIEDMDFDRNRVTVLLEDPDEDAQEDMVVVDIDVYENAYTNAKQYYQNKKANFRKELKTKEAKQIAMKQAELTAAREMEKQQIKHNAVSNRKTYWFEKFYWFLTTENYLVICGRDAGQNEQLIKKYMRKGDVYIHADYHGAASTIIKNNNPQEEIPQQTLEEAAQYAVCRSKAWDSKILSSAYWVYDHQVSKRAETGEYLPHGSFMIRGKKNFITPMRMEMGAALVFKLDDEESVKRHVNDRSVKEENSMSELNPTKAKLEMLKNQEGLELLSQNSQGSELPSYEMLKKKSSQLQNQNGSELKEEVTVVHMMGATVKNKQQQLAQQQQKQAQMSKQQINQLQKKIKDEQKSGGGKKSQKSKKQLQEIEEAKRKLEEEKRLKEANQQNVVNVKRGKASKIRKMKQKYADQTEEERDLKMKLMGAQKVEGFDWKKQADKKNKNNELEQDQENENESENQNENQSQDEKSEKTENEENKSQISESNKSNGKNLESNRKLSKDQKEDLEENEKDEENEDEEEEGEDENEKKKQKAGKKEIDEGKDENIDENQINQELAELNKLVTYLYPEDNYSNMLFVCAPYQTLQKMNCKFLVKLLPGTQKKGKASQEIIQYFSSLKETTPIEKKVMKCIPDQEMINQIIGNCKVNAAGLLKMKQTQKVQKKQFKKAQDKAEEDIKKTTGNLF